MSASRQLRIAMIGARGVPATFGGVERHVEELGSRLVALGHEVTVFCRPNYVTERHATHRGMLLRHLPTIDSKHFDAMAHSAVCSVATVRSPYDVVHYHAIGPGLASPLPRYASRAKVALTVHGLDAERAKWGRVASAVLGTATWMSAHVPDATIVVSRALGDHYRRRYGRATTYIANGVERGVPRPPGPLLDRLGLSPHGYLLFVGRFVPEKAPDLLIRAFRRVEGDVRLVLAGDSSHTSAYAETLRSLAGADPRVVLPGYVYGDDLAELYSNAAAFVNPSALEGLPLTLLEASSHGLPVVVSTIPPHLEVMPTDAPGSRLFTSGDEDGLVAALGRVLADPDTERAGAAGFREGVLEHYSWDAAAEATSALYGRLVAGRHDASAAAGNGARAARA